VNDHSGFKTQAGKIGKDGFNRKIHQPHIPDVYIGFIYPFGLRHWFFARTGSGNSVSESHF
jgi:hypothetical protein